MNVAWDLCWGGGQSTKHCVFPGKVAAAGGEGQLVRAAVEGRSFWCVIGSSRVFCNARLQFALWWLHQDYLRRAEMRWVEMKPEAWSVKCRKWERCNVKGEVRYLEHKALLGVALHRGRARVMFFGQQHLNRFAQSTNTGAALAHYGTCKFYRWKRFDNITLRQHPPRLMRVLLVLFVFIRFNIFATYPHQICRGHVVAMWASAGLGVVLHFLFRGHDHLGHAHGWDHLPTD